jgi:hypothetical protein
LVVVTSVKILLPMEEKAHGLDSNAGIVDMWGGILVGGHAVGVLDRLPGGIGPEVMVDLVENLAEVLQVP